MEEIKEVLKEEVQRRRAKTSKTLSERDGEGFEYSTRAVDPYE